MEIDNSVEDICSDLKCLSLDVKLEHLLYKHLYQANPNIAVNSSVDTRVLRFNSKYYAMFQAAMIDFNKKYNTDVCYNTEVCFDSFYDTVIYLYY